MATTLTNPYTRQSMDEAVRISRTPNNLLTSLFFPVTILPLKLSTGFLVDNFTGNISETLFYNYVVL